MAWRERSDGRVCGGAVTANHKQCRDKTQIRPALATSNVDNSGYYEETAMDSDKY